MSYSVSWDGPSARDPQRGRKATVSTEAELDVVLEQVAVESVAKGVAFAVQINRAASPGAVMIGVGDPGRSFVDWLMDRGHRLYGHEPGGAAGADPVAYDVYGNFHEHPAKESRVTPAVVFGDAKDADVAGGSGADNPNAARAGCVLVWGGTVPMARSPS